MAILPIQYAPNAVIDFSPLNSALDNYNQQIGINNRLAMAAEAERRAAALHPAQLEHARLGNVSLQQNITQAGLMNPLQLEHARLGNVSLQQSTSQAGLMNPLQVSQAQLALEQAQENWRRTLENRADMDRESGRVASPVPSVNRAQALTPPPAGGQPPPSQSGSGHFAPPPGIAVSPPVQQTTVVPRPQAQAAPQPDLEAAGNQFIQNFILNAPPGVGEARFGYLRDDPVFGPVIAQHGLHTGNWLEAAQTMAGVAVTPPTAQGNAPAAPPPAPLQPSIQGNQPPPNAPAGQPPPSSPVSRRERMAQIMLRSVDPAEVDKGLKMIEQVRSEEARLRDQFERRTAPYLNVRDGYQRIQTAFQRYQEDPDGARLGVGDLAMIVGYMQMLDPNSIVREGEQEMVRRTGNIPDRIWGYYLQASTGSSLTRPVKMEVMEMATRLHDTRLRQYTQDEQNFRGAALRMGLDPANVVFQQPIVPRDPNEVRGGDPLGVRGHAQPRIAPAQAPPPSQPPNPFLPQQQPPPNQAPGGPPPQQGGPPSMQQGQPRPVLSPNFPQAGIGGQRPNLPPSPSTPQPNIQQQGQQQGNRPPPQANPAQVLQEAQDAIRNGAPRDAVISRLKSMGINPPPGL